MSDGRKWGKGGPIGSLSNPTDNSAYEEARDKCLEGWVNGSVETMEGVFRAGYTAGRESREGEIARLRDALKATMRLSGVTAGTDPEGAVIMQAEQALQESGDG